MCVLAVCSHTAGFFTLYLPITEDMSKACKIYFTRDKQCKCILVLAHRLLATFKLFNLAQGLVTWLSVLEVTGSILVELPEPRFQKFLMVRCTRRQIVRGLREIPLTRKTNNYNRITFIAVQRFKTTKFTRILIPIR